MGFLGSGLDIIDGQYWECVPYVNKLMNIFIKLSQKQKTYVEITTFLNYLAYKSTLNLLKYL